MDIIPMHQTNQFYIYTHQHGIYFSKTIDIYSTDILQSI